MLRFFALAACAEVCGLRRRFPGHGWIGIWQESYQGVKARAIHGALCARRHDIRTVCEVGFNAGESAVLFLETLPRARLLSFDLVHPSKPWVQPAASRLSLLYGERFTLTLGDSRATVPKLFASRAPVCDAVFIDGSKTFDGRLADVHNLRAAARPGALVILDEVTTRGCVDGTETDEACRRNRHPVAAGYNAAVRAYANATRAGLMRVDQCVWGAAQKNVDGLCLGEFLH